MKTSLTDISKTEQFLEGKLPPADALVFEARMITNRELRLNVHIQKKLMIVLRYFYRRQLRQKAEQAGKLLFNDPGKRDFQNNISQLFKH